MYDTIEEIETLFGVIDESVSLEFKAGKALDDLNDAGRNKLVKEVTALANSAGGTIIYGVAEQRVGPRNVAVHFEPVKNSSLTKDQLTLIITSATEPVFKDFEIHVLEHPDGGRVFVINVEQGATAHQNRHDKKYYHRAGTISEAMYDFSIRDVMNRRSHPRVSVRVDVEALGYQNRHDGVIYRIVPVLTNEGTLTARHWSLWIDLPANIAIFGAVHSGMPARHFGSVEQDSIEYRRIELHSGPTLRNQAGTLILPGQTWSLTLDGSFPEIELKVNHLDGQWLAQASPAIYWSFFLDDAPREDGTIPCDIWRK
ncbi:ATP-binding protein [Paraburkholderia guartelaensis]|uniref:ATP-binding protein n=1 Tax=Paraburkholderia guartelaensis TaxID=2546446 RepID=A0A4R5L136_9BURK|nr:ATP-binding protein [Paraburkholderia guartelaensis]TDG02180.1 ATP-binding protein [Paraburkholderia guartelaensis]